MTLRPYWLGRVHWCCGSASFAAARRLFHLLADAASDPTWRSASTYESPGSSLPARCRPGLFGKLLWHHRFDAGARRHASRTWRQARRTPLLRFCPLQHIPAASHCPGAASRSGTVPLRRLSRRPMCRRGSSLRFSMLSRLPRLARILPFADVAARGGSCIAGSLQAMFRYPYRVGPCRSLAATVAASLLGLCSSQC
jgi:hypothetical protein